MGQVHHIAVRDGADKAVLVIGDRQGPETIPLELPRGILERAIGVKGDHVLGHDRGKG